MRCPCLSCCSCLWLLLLGMALTGLCGCGDESESKQAMGNRSSEDGPGDPLLSALADNNDDLPAALKAIGAKTKLDENGDVSLVMDLPPGITDDSLKHISEFENLSTLLLEGSGITDEGLEHLHGLTKLKFLKLIRTSTTDAGVEQLSQALPNCTIVR